MTVRSVLADFWANMERETGELPMCVDLPAKTFDKLLTEFGPSAKATVASARLMGRAAVLTLTVDGRARCVTREQTKPRSEPQGNKP